MVHANILVINMSEGLSAGCSGASGIGRVVVDSAAAVDHTAAEGRPSRQGNARHNHIIQ